MSDKTIPEIKLTGDRVAVLPDFIDTKTESGLEIVSNRESKPSSGRVIQVGPGMRSAMGDTLPMVVEVGDKCIFDPNLASTITLGNEQIYVFDEPEILAVLTGGEMSVDPQTVQPKS